MDVCAVPNKPRKQTQELSLHFTNTNPKRQLLLLSLLSPHAYSLLCSRHILHARDEEPDICAFTGLYPDGNDNGLINSVLSGRCTRY